MDLIASSSREVRSHVRYRASVYIPGLLPCPWTSSLCLCILSLSDDALPKVDYSTGQLCSPESILLPLVKVSLSLPPFLFPLSVFSVCLKFILPRTIKLQSYLETVSLLKQHSVKCTLIKGHGTSTQERQQHRQEWLKREDVQILCFWLSEVRMSLCWFRAGTSRMWVYKSTV